MPLKEGSSKKIISKNVRELIHTYKTKGKIGNASPESLAKARKIALAAAFSKAGKGR